MQAARPFDALANAASRFLLRKALPSLLHTFGNHHWDCCLAGDLLEGGSRSSDYAADCADYKTACSQKRHKLLTVTTHYIGDIALQ
jgi:hypothetical protein